MDEPQSLLQIEKRLYQKTSTNPNGKPRRQLCIWLPRDLAAYFAKVDKLFVCWRKPGSTLLYSRYGSGYAVPVIPDKQQSGISLNVPRQFHLPLGLRAGQKVKVELVKGGDLGKGEFGLSLS